MTTSSLSACFWFSTGRFHRAILKIALLFWMSFPFAATAQNAPYIDAKAVKERWSSVTARDMEEMRQRKILLVGKSMSACITKGLNSIAKKDKNLALAPDIKAFDVEKTGGLPIIPANYFDSAHFLHILCTRHPFERRVEEVDQLLRQAPWKFGGKIDVVMIIYADVDAKTFPIYSDLLKKLQADFPATRIVFVTTSLYADGPKKGDNEHMNEFSDLIRKKYKGKAPIYDLGAVLTDDFRNGLVMLPEYTADPTGVHPNTDLGLTTSAKGFILAVKETLQWKGTASFGVGAPAVVTSKPKQEALPQDHPEYKAVRAILDKNGFSSMQVEGHIEVQGGHVVRLAIQEAGFTVIPDEIGALTKLKSIQCYGDRTLQHPYLKSISPMIGNCVELEELLLNSNDLATLPVEITQLTKLHALSIADNRLKNVPPAVETWLKKFDPNGLEQQVKP